MPETYVGGKLQRLAPAGAQIGKSEKHGKEVMVVNNAREPLETEYNISCSLLLLVP